MLRTIILESNIRTFSSNMPISTFIKYFYIIVYIILYIYSISYKYLFNLHFSFILFKRVIELGETIIIKYSKYIARSTF